MSTMWQIARRAGAGRYLNYTYVVIDYYLYEYISKATRTCYSYLQAKQFMAFTGIVQTGHPLEPFRHGEKLDRPI